jgi:hypothetical protein
MPLTPAQRATLLADINADGTLSAHPLTPDGHALVAAAYNATASPSFTVWRTDVQVRELTDVFVWTEIDALTVGKARIWDWMTRGVDTINASKANVRQGLLDGFSAATATRAACIVVAKRFCTRGERVFATGTGSDATPGLLVFEGLLTVQDIAEVRVPAAGGGWTVEQTAGVFANGATTFNLVYKDNGVTVATESQKVTGLPAANWIPVTAGVRLKQLKALKTFTATVSAGPVTPSEG